MINGKCLCGEIQYSLKSELLFLYNCHCTQCRAFSGSSFATNASIIAKDLEISDKNGNMSVYKTDSGCRHFCKSCGTPIYSFGKDNEEYPTLHCGSIIGYPEKKVDANFWLSEKCSWVNINQEAENFDYAPE
ncbi:GFA family protein [Oceanicoccus sp. KOV_DT_Chl]|uniref:GFA family protein n=1 Tax=Oceanicoccus sp. KOV_DT_Chl TaxID=1904639 RepID=UPI000C7D7BE8|nr:GFA family protein [Oceanicoccus sp. KOV_DT_Chl]